MEKREANKKKFSPSFLSERKCGEILLKQCSLFIAKRAPKKEKNVHGTNTAEREKKGSEDVSFRGFLMGQVRGSICRYVCAVEDTKNGRKKCLKWLHFSLFS